MIERAIRDLLAVPVDTLYIDTLSIAQRLERSTQDGARFCIIVGPAHERKGTANIHNLRAESRAQRMQFKVFICASLLTGLRFLERCPVP